MKRLLRLVQEAFYALTAYRNFWVYFGERLGLYGDGKAVLVMRNGLRYAFRTHSDQVRVINELWNLNIYDKFRSAVPEQGTVVDIGTHIGVFSMKAASWRNNVRVISYEPMPKNFEILQENIRLNHFENKITPVNMAVADTEGTLTLYVKNRESGGASLYKKDNATDGFTVAVKTLPLAALFEKHGITQCDFMKIDCEGGEVPILTSTPRELFKRIKTMTIEWHDDLSPMPRTEFTKFLTDLGYTVTFDEPTGTIYAGGQ